MTDENSNTDLNQKDASQHTTEHIKQKVSQADTYSNQKSAQTDSPSGPNVRQKNDRAKETQPDWGPVYENAIKQAEDLIDDPHETIDIEKLMDEVEKHNDETVNKRKIPLPLKIFGIISIFDGVVGLALSGFIAYTLWQYLGDGYLATYTNTTLVILIIFGFSLFALVVMSVVLGVRLLLDKRRHAARQTWVMVGLYVVVAVCDIMLFGIDASCIFLCVIAGLLAALAIYLDPELTKERQLKRKLRNLETEENVVDNTLGRDRSGKGYIALDFFNLFWVFIVASILGLLLETVNHFLFVEPGTYQDRAGILFGPFSPIYGFGAALMTLALNCFHKKNVVFIFLVSAVIGGAFEFFVSWFMEVAFGAVAWDYSGTFLSIDGRTNAQFMCIWGVLGVFWIKLCLPLMLKLVNMIPWKARYTITTVCATLMIINGIMTLQALDCWYERLSGKPQETPIEQFYAQNFDNEYMANRFQSMTIIPDTSARADG